jgi:uncharacterized lipoprotein YddW (UPF0748 family)
MAFLCAWALVACRQSIAVDEASPNRPVADERVPIPPSPTSTAPIGTTPVVAPGAPSGAPSGAPIMAPLPKKVALRGAWLTNVGSQILYDKALLREAFSSMKAWGLNAAYVVVWHKGYTLYPSEVARKFSGAAVEPHKEIYRSWDMLAECVKLGKEFGISVIPWFEWGLKIPEGHSALKSRAHWFTKQSNGQIFAGSDPRFAYLNPTLDEVRGFFADLVTELLGKYDVQGVQFDDHFSLARAFGYDDATKSVFRSRHGREAPANTSDSAWKSVRANMVTDMLHYVLRAAKAKKPNLILSVAPIGYPFSYDEHLVEWPRWLDMGLVNEVIVQVYREDIPSFRRELGTASIQKARGKVKSVGIGVWAGYPEKRIDIDFVVEKSKIAQSQGYGVAYFYYEALKTWMPANETAEERRRKLGQFFSEPARSH